MNAPVLLVEDDEWLAQSYSRLLVREGFATVHATHAMAAIDMIDAERPSVIVLDLLLHGTTALALLHELQSHPDLADIPVLLITTIADEVSASDLKAYGVVAVLDKSTIMPTELLAAVRRALP